MEGLCLVLTFFLSGLSHTEVYFWIMEGYTFMVEKLENSGKMYRYSRQVY